MHNFFCVFGDSSQNTSWRVMFHIPTSFLVSEVEPSSYFLKASLYSEVQAVGYYLIKAREVWIMNICPRLFFYPAQFSSYKSIS